MSTIKNKRFTKPLFLKQLAGVCSASFLTDSTPRWARSRSCCRRQLLDDDAYFGAVAKITNVADSLPDNLVEAAYAISEGMANEEGQDRLERAISTTSRIPVRRRFLVRLDMAVQAKRGLPTRNCSLKNSTATAYAASLVDYFGNRRRWTGQTAQPTTKTLGLMTADLWKKRSAKESRAADDTHIEIHKLDGDWFLIHGDTYARVQTVQMDKCLSCISVRQR